MKLSWKRSWVVARREYLTTVRRKAFLLTLIAMPLYFGGIMVYATRSADSNRLDNLRRFTSLAVVDSSGLFASAPRFVTTRLPADPGGAPGQERIVRTGITFYRDQAGLEAALRSGRTSRGLVIGADYLVSGRLRRYTRSENILTSGGGTQTVERWLAQGLLAGRVDSARAARAALPAPALEDYALSRAGRFELKDERREALEFMIPFLFSILLGTCIITGGQYLLQGLSEEKESRILESLLCTLSADDLLAGKLLGLGAAGLTLVAVWMTAGLALGGPMMAMTHVQPPPGMLVLAVAYFLLGYLFYGSLMTAIGAVTNNMREAQQFAMMFTFAIFLPFLALTTILGSPNGATAVGLSLFPPTAATTMMLRLALPSSDVPAWQLAVSLALLALTCWLVLRGAARVFRIGLLMTGKPPNLPEILRWARAGK
jgi:ABC-2 type transport system permease protein